MPANNIGPAESFKEQIMEQEMKGYHMCSNAKTAKVATVNAFDTEVARSLYPTCMHSMEEISTYIS